MNINHYIKASTLIETIVAMVLLSIAFSAGLMIYLNVLRSNNLELRSRSHISLEAVLLETKEKQAFIDGEIEHNGFQIQRKITDWQGQKDLILLELQAKTPEGRVVGSMKNIYYLP